MTDIINSIKEFFSLLPTIRVTDILDILLVAFLIYQVIRMIRSTSTARIARTIIAFLVFTWVTGILGMRTTNWILDRILEVGFIALLIMFQPELRRFMEKIGGKSFKELLDPKTREGDMGFVIAQTVKACEIMSQDKVGALIVFERGVFLEEFYKTGTVVDARLTSELLRNIFFPKASLHDGAVIVSGGRIAAAGCVLPLTSNTHLSSDLGTRHRAGVGMSEASDAVVVIVSEETGTISVAIGGMLKRHLAPQTLEKLLRTELITAEDNGKQNAFQRIKNRLKRKEQ